MRTDIPPQMLDATSKPYTAPGYLVQIDFPTPFRCSTRGTLTFAGENWLAAPVSVSGITFNSAAAQRASLVFFDADSLLTALIQHHGIADRRVLVYKFDADAAEYPVGVFVGAGRSVSGDASNKITIELMNLTSRTTRLPRMFISKEFGFNHIPVDGTVLTIGATPYTLKVRR